MHCTGPPGRSLGKLHTPGVAGTALIPPPLEPESLPLPLEVEPESLPLEVEPESLPLEVDPESLPLEVVPEPLPLEVEPEPLLELEELVEAGGTQTRNGAQGIAVSQASPRVPRWQTLPPGPGTQASLVPADALPQQSSLLVHASPSALQLGAASAG